VPPTQLAQPDNDTALRTGSTDEVVREAEVLERPRYAVDVVIAAVLVASVFVVHPVSYVFHYPLWLDEAWVGTLARAPLGKALTFSSSTPIGWLMLVRLVPGGRGEQLRVVPLLFSAASVVTAYLLARSLPWSSTFARRVIGVAVAIAVLLVPASLMRNDLKQYTGDVFFALLLFALGARAERSTGSKTLVELGIATLVATLFSSTAAFVAAAVFGGLAGAAGLKRSRTQVRMILVAGAATGVGVALYFALVVIPHTNPALRDFWDYFYLPTTPHVLSTIWGRAAYISPVVGLSLVAALVLFAAGCRVLAQLGRPALGLAFAMLWIEMIVVAMARRYPFLEARTSTFLLVVSMVPITIGVVGLAQLLRARSNVLAVGLVVLVLMMFLPGALPYVRWHSIPAEDSRSATLYVARHRQPGDVILVTLASSYGFSYYWPKTPIAYVKDDAVSMGFVTRADGVDHVVYADGLKTADTTRALQRALAEVHANHGSTIWIVRSHMYDDEAAAWRQTFRRLGVHPVAKFIGAEPIWVLHTG